MRAKRTKHSEARQTVESAKAKVFFRLLRPRYVGRENLTLEVTIPKELSKILRISDKTPLVALADEKGRLAYEKAENIKLTKG